MFEIFYSNLLDCFGISDYILWFSEVEKSVNSINENGFKIFIYENFIEYTGETYASSGKAWYNICTNSVAVYLLVNIAAVFPTRKVGFIYFMLRFSK